LQNVIRAENKNKKREKEGLKGRRMIENEKQKNTKTEIVEIKNIGEGGG
jgi:hypothetical protein